uniref:Uncharacterized protein n=1 Tax=Strongyloides venezuelensis TaxID=75913 RepID=A0A0K0FJ77_STRVS
MNIFYNDYYITFIILSILFLQYQALENNARNEDGTSLDLKQNVLSSKNFINQDSLVHSKSENKDLKKSQGDKKGKQNKKKSVSMKRNKKCTS